MHCTRGCERPRDMDCPGRLERSVPDFAGPCTPGTRGVYPCPFHRASLTLALPMAPRVPGRPREPSRPANRPAVSSTVQWAYLTLPWWVYQQGAMGFDTLRVWLGTLELVEKRCCTAPDTPAHYDPEKLRRLLRAPRLAPVTAGLQQLEALGLLAWSPQVIQFLPQAQALRQALGQDGYQTLRAQLAPGLRW